MENLLVLGVPILKHIRVLSFSYSCEAEVGVRRRSSKETENRKSTYNRAANYKVLVWIPELLHDLLVNNSYTMVCPPIQGGNP